MLRIEGIDERTTAIQVFDVRGALVGERGPSALNNWQLKLPDGPGTYVVVIHAAGERFVERVVAF
jgi:hypothetical protein